MYLGGVTFNINKSFVNFQLVPEDAGLRLVYTPIENNQPEASSIGHIDILLPIDAVGGLWATTKAFLYSVESLDENIILQEKKEDGTLNDVLVKLYREKPKGDHGQITGKESCWLRLVNGRSEEERRRLKLGPRDLLCLELACQSVLSLAASTGAHKPQKT